MRLNDIQAAQADLPIWEALPELCRTLAAHSRAILVAPPGAGKSSIVPLALLNEPWLAGRRILMLEPRRLAARSLAWRLAELCNEPLGGVVGLRTRDETIVSPKTRIEVLTEALLTRRLQADPELLDVGAVLFDEFHERSLHADLGLALARDVQTGLREDLRLLLMSATLDDRALESQLDAPVVRTSGRSFPVDVRHETPDKGLPSDQAIARVISKCLREEAGSILVFLPGEAEIRRVAQRLNSADVPAKCTVHPLYGRLDRSLQQQAISSPAAGHRKIVLATSVAETSLTIQGVTVVIDSGLSRQSVYDPNVGFGALHTRRVSRDAADQRAGRAGRTQPGVCIRLWSSEEVLAPVREPEIRSADLSGLALNAAAWGSEPVWLEPPPEGAWAQALSLLQDLQLLDTQNRITPAGKQVVDWGAQARIGRMLVLAQQDGSGVMACDLAAMLESDTRADRNTDLHQRWLAWRKAKVTPPWAKNLDRDAQRWRRRLGLGSAVAAQEHDSALLLAAAFPDRIALSRGTPGAFLLSNGRGARIAVEDPLAHQKMLVVVEVDGGNAQHNSAKQAQIRSAVALDPQAFRAWAGARIRREERVIFNPRSRAVESREVQCFSALILHEKTSAQVDPERVRVALLEGVRTMGVALLPWSGPVAAVRGRLQWLSQRDAAWPNFADEVLQAELEDWLGPWLSGLRKFEQIDDDVLQGALLSRLDAAQRGQFDNLAPAHVSLPGGRRFKLDYVIGEAPVLAIRVQDVYGQDASPQVAGQPVLLHLLSPARRPLAVTSDLASFWRNAWPEVRKQMRGRYPRHDWPEKPWEAVPSRPKPRQR